MRQSHETSGKPKTGSSSVIVRIVSSVTGPAENPHRPTTWVVTPCSTAEIAPGSERFETSEWVCRSTMPGATTSPRASMRWRRRAEVATAGRRRLPRSAQHPDVHVARLDDDVDHAALERVGEASPGPASTDQPDSRSGGRPGSARPRTGWPPARGRGGMAAYGGRARRPPLTTAVSLHAAWLL